MRLPNEFLREARAISAVLARQIPVALDGVYVVAHELAEDGYRFHPGFDACHDGVVNGHLHNVINQLLANNLHHLVGREVNAFHLAREIERSGVYDSRRLAFFELDAPAVAR